MFKKARIKLTAWYLAIIMVISLSFSVAIYLGVNRELMRLENMQVSRQARVDRLSTFLRDSGLSIPPEPPQMDSESVEQARVRILSALGIINLSILILAGGGGYFLAGETLDPISKMVDEQKEFVSNASHELRTPLTSLKTEIEVALRDKGRTLAESTTLLKSNLEDVNEMQKLSNYLLNLNRYEREAHIEFNDVDLKDVVTEAVQKTSSLAKQKNIAVKLSSKSANVTGNKDALVELATILLDNAIKYSGKGKTIEVKVKSDGILEVTDHGVGIADTDIPHIFDRFYRAESSRSKEKTDGYGLGLAIAKSITDLHRGKIEVESKAGKGSTFRVELI